MSSPGVHAILLARRDFPVPPGGDFSPAERDLLTRYGRWLEALATGGVAPATPDQERFIRVARGEEYPATEFERVWEKLVRHRAEVARRFTALAQARAEAAAVEAEYSAARSAILAAIREQLDELDVAFAGRMLEAGEAKAAAEAAVRELVLQLGQSVHLAGIQVAYHPGRVTWDPEKMERYAVFHPEVREFRKVGKPWVSLRFTDAPPDGAAPRQLPPGESDPAALPSPDANHP